MKKQNLIYLFIFVFICIATILSCEKENSSDSDFISQNKDLKSDLMKEPMVIKMLSDIKPYGIYVNSHGLLEFKSGEDINKVLDILEYYTHEFEDKEEKYPTHPILLAFETAYKFNSLRYGIETQIVELEQKDNLSEKMIRIIIIS